MRGRYAFAFVILLGMGVVTMGCAGEFTDLGIPVKRGMVIGKMVGPDAKGEMTKLYFNFNQDGPLFLVQVDPVTGETKQFNAEQGRGAWGFIVGPDNRIYLGTCGSNGAIMRFDPAQPEKGIEYLGPPSQTESYTWMFTIGKDHKTLYGCTYPQAKIISYNTETGEMKDHGRMSETEMYSRAIATGANGWIYTSVGFAQNDIIAFDPKTGQHQSVTTEEQRSDPTTRSMGATVHNGADGHAYGRIGKQWLRLLDGKGEPLADNNPAPAFDQALPDGRVLTDADFSGKYVLTNPNTGEKTEGHFDYAGAGCAPFMVGIGPDECIYGSTAMPLLLFRHDPATGENVDLGNPVSTDGEIYSMHALDGKLWVCAYGSAYLSSYDPKLPWNFGSGPENNPRDYGTMGDGHLRPRAMLIGPGKTIYVGSHPAYGQLGGAMGVFDPAQGKVVENYRNIVQNQSITALAYDEKSGLIFGGSGIYGGGGSTPTEKEAHFYVWDPVEKAKTQEFVANAGDIDVASMAVGAGKVFYITRPSGTLCVYDIAQGEVIERKPSSLGTPLDISLGLHTDGKLYGLTNTSIFSIDPATHEIAEVAKYEGGIGCGWAMTEAGIYFGSGVHLMRYGW